MIESNATDFGLYNLTYNSMVEHLTAVTEFLICVSHWVQSGLRSVVHAGVV